MEGFFKSSLPPSGNNQGRWVNRQCQATTCRWCSRHAVNSTATWVGLSETCLALINYTHIHTAPGVSVPLDDALGANTFLSSTLGAESPRGIEGLLLAGVSYTYEPAPPMFTPVKVKKKKKKDF